MSINRKYFKTRVLPLFVLSATLFSCVPKAGAQTAIDVKPAGSTKPALSWQSHARLRHVVRKEHGDIMMGVEGMEFRSANGRTLKWPFLEIKTFSLASHKLVIETYTNRNRHVPGLQQYRLDLDQAIPPNVAAEFAREVQRPTRNEVPDPTSPSIRIVLAHHQMRTGGSNGALRFRNDGIDYVTSAADDNRSWRWADLQTLSKPDPYHLVIFGYRDTYSFDLKEPVPQPLFDRLTDEVASHNAAESELMH